MFSTCVSKYIIIVICFPILWDDFIFGLLCRSPLKPVLYPPPPPFLHFFSSQSSLVLMAISKVWLHTQLLGRISQVFLPHFAPLSQVLSNFLNYTLSLHLTTLFFKNYYMLCQILCICESRFQTCIYILASFFKI